MILGARLATAASLLAVGAADAALLAAWRSPLGWAALCAALTVNGLVVARQAMLLRRGDGRLRHLDGTLAALRRVMAGDQILADTGTRLLTAADPAAVHALAVDGAAALLAGIPSALVALLVPDAESLVVTAAVPTAEGLAGLVVTPPPALRARLLAGDIVGVAAVAELGVPGVAADRAALILPLVVNGRFFGVLSVTADHPLRADLRRALETLRTQVALALDGVALTAELRVRALHDPLTGLGNRALIGERLAQALARSRRTGRRVAALLLDLNGFKLINDTMGHEAGDELLRAVAGRLTHCVRLEDTVGRLGGDEFVVIAEDLPDLTAAARLAERVVASVDTPIVVNGRRLPTSASVGLALSTDASTPEELLRHADTAMYTAKRRKSSTFQVYSPPNAA
jgi:diguanylate cyclase (GGDEF)-like protein